MRSASLSLGVLLALASPSLCSSQDWNQWRGPRRDGKVTSFQALAQWPAKLARRWRVEVGLGHSSPVVAGSLVYLMTRNGEEEAVRCLQAKDGKEVWKQTYAAPFHEQIFPARKHPKGPFSTPVFYEGRLYALGVNNILSCFEGKTGKVIWRKETGKEFPSPMPLFGAGMSPLADSGVIIVYTGGDNKGALMAFDAKTGAVRWRSEGDGPGYASPMVATFQGVKQIVTQTQYFCAGYDFATGKRLWEIRHVGTLSHNSITPSIMGDKVVFGGNFRATFAIKPSRNGEKWSAEKVWETRDFTLSTSSLITVGYRIYGFSERKRGQMFCIDGSSGKTLWTNEGGMGENASLYDCAGVLLSFGSDGSMSVWQPSGDNLKQIARYEVADSPIWASPAIVGNRVFVKDENSLAMWEMPAK